MLFFSQIIIKNSVLSKHYKKASLCTKELLVYIFYTLNKRPQYF